MHGVERGTYGNVQRNYAKVSKISLVIMNNNLLEAHFLKVTSKGDFSLPLNLYSNLLKTTSPRNYLNAFDAGAFRGAFPERIAARSKEFQKVNIHCFDANKHNLDFIRDADIYPEITLNNVALIEGDQSEVIFSIPSTSYVDETRQRSWGGRVISKSELKHEDQFIVAAMSLCRYISINDLTAPGLLKIDVQGGELDVVKGASSYLKSIPLVHMECQLNGNRDINFVHYMQDQNFEVLFDEYQVGLKNESDIDLLEKLNIEIRHHINSSCIFCNSSSSSSAVELLNFLKKEGQNHFSYFQTDLMCINKTIINDWKTCIVGV